MTLSVIVIARNEEAVIRRCLASAAFADEVVVLDGASTDRTADIARELGARVTVAQDWPGFGPQKNRALELATGDWVLSLDADEWVSEELAREIRERVAAPGEFSAFRMPRLSSYCGRFMRYSGWRPDYVLRLFRRGSARFSNDLVHERLVVSGAVGTLRSDLLHESYVSPEEVLDKVNAYSSAGAQMLHRSGRPAGLAAAVARAAWTFFKTYVLRLGFLDGAEGFMLAVSNAETTYYKYLKLRFLKRKDPQRE